MYNRITEDDIENCPDYDADFEGGAITMNEDYTPNADDNFQKVKKEKKKKKKKDKKVHNIGSKVDHKREEGGEKKKEKGRGRRKKKEGKRKRERKNKGKERRRGQEGGQKKRRKDFGKGKEITGGGTEEVYTMGD